MARRTDYAPIGNTCPMIDRVIDLVKVIYDEYEEFSQADYKSFEELMEKIREANSTLRDWGNDECLRAAELEKELDRANSTIEDLKDDAKSLQEEIKSLEKQVETLENDILEANDRQ